MESHATRHAVKRTAVLVAAAALLSLLLSANAFAGTIATSSGDVDVSINGHGTVAVTTGTNHPSCTSPASTAQSSASDCTTINGPANDACTGNSESSVCHVALQATAPDGWSFAGWGGDCSGTSATCTLEDMAKFCDDSGPKPVCETDYSDHSVTASFTDTRAPTTTFIQAPPAWSSTVYSDTQSQQFTFNTDEDDESPTFQCKKDSGPYSACASGITWSSISDGLHDFCVRATDPSGLRGAETCRQWDQETNPTVSITGHPASISGPSVNFTYTSNKAGRTDFLAFGYNCDLDHATFYSFCPADGMAYTGLADGQHSFSVVSIFMGEDDDSGEPQTSSPATYTWTVDATPPDTTISGGPADGSSTSDSSATFTLGSSETGSTYMCSLDGASLAPCSSTPSYSGLSLGPHTFEAAAVDAVGNQDPSPVSRSWTVVAAPSGGGGNGGGGNGSGGTPVLRTTSPLVISSHAAGHQKVLRRGGIAVTVSCSAACSLKAGGTISIPGAAKAYRLRSVRATLKGAGSKTLLVKLPKRALGALRKALARHRKASARITVTASGAGTTRVKLKVTK